MGVEGSWYLISYNQDPTTPTIPSAAKYLMRRGWVHTRPKYFMRVEPCVRYPPRHAKRDGERRNEVGPLTGGAQWVWCGPNHLCLPHPMDPSGWNLLCLGSLPASVVIFYAQAGKEWAQRQGLLLRRAHQIRAGRDSYWPKPRAAKIPFAQGPV